MSDLSLTVQADLDLIKRETPSQRIIEVCITAPTSRAGAARTGLNLALVLDRSGSMTGHKIGFAKKAADHVLSLLGDIDKVSLVAFDDEVLSLPAAVPVTEEGRRKLKDLVHSIEPGGSTNLSGGWLQGCQQVAEIANKQTINRTLLLTDGLANEGITDMEELGMHARQIHNLGVSTSTFGIGEGFNEHLLELMANQGGGNFYFIETPERIPEIFARELKELTAITAHNVEIEIELPAHVEAQVPGGWKQEQKENRLRIWVGDMASDQTREIYLKLLTPPSESMVSLDINVTVRALGEKEALLEARTRLALRYADSDQVAAAPPNRPLLSRFSEVEVAEAANEALKLERKGKLKEAKLRLKHSLVMAAPYLTEEKAAEYNHLAEKMASGLQEDSRKAAHQNSYNDRKRRTR